MDSRIAQVVEDFFDGRNRSLCEVGDGLGFKILPQLLLHSGVELAGRQGRGVNFQVSKYKTVVFLCAVVCHVHLSLAAVSCSAARRPPLSLHVMLELYL